MLCLEAAGALRYPLLGLGTWAAAHAGPPPAHPPPHPPPGCLRFERPSPTLTSPTDGHRPPGLASNNSRPQAPLHSSMDLRGRGALYSATYWQKDKQQQPTTAALHSVVTAAGAIYTFPSFKSGSRIN